MRLCFREGGEAGGGGGRASTVALLARSPGEAATLGVLLRALIAAAAVAHLPKEEGAPAALELRRDDRLMPPAPRLVGWLALKPSGAAAAFTAAFGRTSKVFAMLGRSKLLLFGDGLCTSLKQLITLEAGTLQVGGPRARRR